ncbi:MAG: response regulator transcription factor [Bacteroidia bacterium]|nr:response regulator transcription factor [Bacteroidia bacterium]
MKVLLIDNEPAVLDTYKQLIIEHCHGIEQLTTANGVATGLKAIKDFEPDIVFLDVEMDDGTGFDLINQIQNYDFQLIFVTAHDKYAFNAFKISALDYIQKPVDVDELINAFEKAVKSIKSNNISRQIEILNQSLNNLHSQEQKIVLKDSKSIYFIQIHDILFCEAESSYTSFTLNNDQKIVVSKPLKEYEIMLEPFGFIRTHHSYLVNSKKIIRLDKTNGGNIILEDGRQIPISQRKWDHVMTILGS